MPFGLKNAPATFQRLMDVVLSGLQGTDLFVYLDDIVIYARDITEHENKFKNLAKRLTSAGLTLQTEKCHFLNREVTYLGHIISAEGVRPNASNIFAVKNFPTPKDKKGIKQFVALAGYYRRFIRDFAKIAIPLTQQLKKLEKFEWTDECQSAFEYLKAKITERPVLKYPDFDKPCTLTTDASDYAIGAVLSQKHGDFDHPIAFYSRALKKLEIAYDAMKKELLAIVNAVEYFKTYLYGKRFTLVTDNRALTYIKNKPDIPQQLQRWQIILNGYDYDIVHKPGKLNVVADALSRNPAEIMPIRQREDSSSENTRDQETKRQKLSPEPSHQTRGRSTTDTGSGNPAPRKKQNTRELSTDESEDSQAAYQRTYQSDSDEPMEQLTEQKKQTQQETKKPPKKTKSKQKTESVPKTKDLIIDTKTSITELSENEGEFMQPIKKWLRS